MQCSKDECTELTREFLTGYVAGAGKRDQLQMTMENTDVSYEEASKSMRHLLNEVTTPGNVEYACDHENCVWMDNKNKNKDWLGD